MRYKKIIAVAILPVFILSLTACKNVKETLPSASVTEKKPQVESQADPHAGMVQSSISGQYISPEKANTRPFAIMIENTKACQPHYGINKASVIYECPVEGGITREMGIFEDVGQLDRLGNVRSCRPYYVYIASEYNAVYVHFGQSEQGKALLATGIVSELNGLSSIGNSVFFRTTDKKAPHNAYTSTNGLNDGVSLAGIDMNYNQADYQHFKFNKDESRVTLDAFDECKAVKLYYFNNSPYFIYDDASGLYKRYQFNEPEADAADNGNQVAVSNIIIQNVESSFYDDQQYRVKLELNGSGSGKFITNGHIEDITWKKDSDTAPTRYYDAGGNEIVLNVGKTFVEIVQNQYAARNQFYKTADEMK